MAFGKNAHDCDHASAQSRSHQVGWRKVGPFPAVIDRSVRRNSATGRGMNSFSLQLPFVFDLDFDHERSIRCAQECRQRRQRPALVLALVVVLVLDERAAR